MDAGRPSEAGVRRMVEELGEMTRVLADAKSPDEAEVYNALGLTITCHPEQHLGVAEARPGGATERVGGPSSALPDLRIRPW